MTTTARPDTAPAAASALSSRRLAGLAAVAGLVAAMATLGTAQVMSLLLGGVGDPFTGVGSLIVDLVPPGVKNLVIDLFDTADKLVLFLSLGLVVAVLAVGAGVLELRRRPLGSLVLVAVGAVALGAVLTRAAVTPIDAAPTVVGVLVGVIVLRALVDRIRDWRDVAAGRHLEGVVASAADPAAAAVLAPSPQRVQAVQYERRAFLRTAIVLGAVSALAGVGARVISSAASAVNELRTGIRLPAAAVPAAALPADPAATVSGLSTFITPNPDFYRIDTALQVPSIDPAEWSLRITGMVEEDVEIGYDELLALPLEEHVVTLACVSNEVGGGLIGNAAWLGYPIRELLARARPTAGADMVLSRSIDGFTASTPLEALQDEGRAALLAVGMNGEPLPLAHGFPVRMVVPGLFGYVSATKWVTELTVTTFAADAGYWTTRGWTARGPVKLSSRIDTPTRGTAAGRVTVAGVAWAQHTGIASVEVRIDDGAWQPATLAPTATVDSWLQWWLDWDAPAGSHTITVRATDLDGNQQETAEAPPAPDGSTGLHSVRVDIS
jgi:DMSO/TMAO reductase YedYZ molybdopterin-dependent catalytic subunit